MLAAQTRVSHDGCFQLYERPERWLRDFLAGYRGPSVCHASIDMLLSPKIRNGPASDLHVPARRLLGSRNFANSTQRLIAGHSGDTENVFNNLSRFAQCQI